MRAEDGGPTKRCASSCFRRFSSSALIASCFFISCSCSNLLVRSLGCLMAYFFSSVQFSSVAQSCPTLCDPMNRSMPGLPVHHQLPEFTQTHIHRVSDAIQPSHPLSSPSPPAPTPSQHQAYLLGGAFSSSLTLCHETRGKGLAATHTLAPGVCRLYDSKHRKSLSSRPVTVGMSSHFPNHSIF